MAYKKTNKNLKNKVKKKSLRKDYPDLKRQLRLMASNLEVAKKRKLDMEDNRVAKLLREKGYLTKQGKISEKGRKALRYL